MEGADHPAINYGQLDDFLRVDLHGTDSEPDFEEHKDQEDGIRDIHLQDMRQWSGTLYLQIYSIPESWLSLVSQTTRLANVIDVVNASKSEVPLSFNAALKSKSARLETMICTLASQNASSHTGNPQSDTTGDPATQQLRPPSEAMLRALNSALLIFFYRRIRDVHPWILQVHVNEVITALKEFDHALAQNSSYKCGTVGTPWPAFMAGCEAMASADQNWIISWLEKSSKKSAPGGYRLCVEVMREVWRRREPLTTSDGANEGHCTSRSQPRPKSDTKCSWVHVLRDKKRWPMLY